MKRVTRIAVVVASVAVSVLLSSAIRRQAPKSMLMWDFGEIYFASRALMQRQDPYNAESAANLLPKELAAESVKLPGDPVQAAMAGTILGIEINLPTALFLLAPLAMLPWAIAQNLWILLIAGALALGAFLLWDLGAESAPDVWLLLVSTLSGKLLTMLLRRPTPLVLLATGCFYLWVYFRCSSLAGSAAPRNSLANAQSAEAAT